jgi:uncharacterized delta-60 repeat protein
MERGDVDLPSFPEELSTMRERSRWTPLRRSRARALPSLTAAVVVALIVFAPSAIAAGGDLDPSFGGDGRVTHGGTFSGTSVALQSDGKIVVAGGVLDEAGETRSAVARYEADGRLDPSFGIDGVVVTPFRTAAGCWDVTNAVVIQGDGKIVAVGLSYCARSLFAMARYDADGNLDPSFGTGGTVLTSFGPRATCSAHAEAAAIQADGKVIAAGIARCGTGGPLLDYRYAVARYDTDGNLDPTFGHGGRVRTNFTPGYDNLADVALAPGGKIVVAGTSAYDFIDDPDATEMGFALARYRADGSLDPTFGGDGKVIRHLHSRLCGGSPIADAVAVQPDGKIVAAGMVGCAPKVGALPGPYFVVARFRVNGSLDPSFGRHGSATTVFHVGDRAAEAYDVAIQANGRIVAAGWEGVREGVSERTDFALLRYTTGGRPDPTFGGDGKVATRFGSRHCESRIAAIVIQPNRRILAVGSSCGGTSMARYLAD